MAEVTQCQPVTSTQTFMHECTHTHTLKVFLDFESGEINCFRSFVDQLVFGGTISTFLVLHRCLGGKLTSGLLCPGTSVQSYERTTAEKCVRQH